MNSIFENLFCYQSPGYDSADKPVSVTRVRIWPLSIAITAILLTSIAIMTSLASHSTAKDSPVDTRRVIPDDGKRFGWNPLTRQNEFMDTAQIRALRTGTLKPKP